MFRKELNEYGNNTDTSFWNNFIPKYITLDIFEHNKFDNYQPQKEYWGYDDQIKNFQKKWKRHSLQKRTR